MIENCIFIGLKSTLIEKLVKNYTEKLIEHREIMAGKSKYLTNYTKIFFYHRKPSQTIIKCCIDFVDTFFDAFRDPADQRMRDELKRILIRLSDVCHPKFIKENKRIFELIDRDPTLT